MTLLVLLLSVLLGFALALIAGLRGNQWSRPFVTFSGAYLFAITILHLLPEIYHPENESQHTVGFLILLGFLTQFGLEFISKGLEHGHAHHHKNTVPTLMFLGLFIHEFIEGLPLGASESHLHHHADLHQNLLLGIAVHKVPIAFIVYGFLSKSSMRPWIRWMFLILFTIMTPVGMYFGASGWLQTWDPLYLLAFTMGIFLHVSTTIMFESSESHSFNVQRVMMTLLGIATAMATSALL